MNELHGFICISCNDPCTYHEEAMRGHMRDVHHLSLNHSIRERKILIDNEWIEGTDCTKTIEVNDYLNGPLIHEIIVHKQLFTFNESN